MWSTAEQFAQRCARDYDEEENRLRLKVEGDAAARTQLERKARRWEQAAKLAENAKQAYTAMAIEIGKIVPPDSDAVKADRD